ncbi:dipeptide ABC transporter ATP-binding protein [Paenochrobactrum sp. BZR 588]|uniref:dipeptide ABC transporter ATP-binding protein n=1 Tax=unclassified Paenochrobactrum TaxID=2639760 RepID=UPI0038518A97
MPLALKKEILTVNDLSVRFQDGNGYVEAVKNISFELAKGEILAIVGESGSGKSATAMAILNLLPGNAKVTGFVGFATHDLININKQVMRDIRGKRIAVIFQDPAGALDPVFSIGFQLDEAIRLYKPEMPRKARLERAAELLNQVGINDAQKRLSRYPHQFSGGQLQRIMIAMALAGDPEILIADEPTTALDVTVQQDILDLLYRLNQEKQMALLLITHDMGVVADLAHRVIVMRQGEIVETASANTLFAKPSQDYTRQLLAAVPDQQTARSKPKIISAKNAPVIVELRDVRLAYASGFGRRTEIVKGVSFDIHAGSFMGLIGESGSGKTTIGRSLLGLLKPNAGSIRFTDAFIDGGLKAQSKQWRKHIGAVFQNPASSLNPRVTIGQSIAEPLQTQTDFTAQEIKTRVAELLEQVGLPRGWEKRLPSELSGGQRQRIAIARALALKPRLLIADEPTSALDVSVQADILQLLENLQNEYGFACLFISHDLAVVRNICRSVIVLRNGAIVETGSVSSVLDNPQDPYTRQLIASAPVADPAKQAERRNERFSGKTPQVRRLSEKQYLLPVLQGTVSAVA